ncbi:MAG: hypothetical protein N3D09_04230 [Archaeoglobaceae archaeon]|nr:hypothetical protein [Archaeoglobaceae archaeon]
MARRLEKRSARILALILAFIMLGSIFTLIPMETKVEKRDVKLKIDDFRNWVDLAPENGFFYYFNMTELNYLAKRLGKNDPLVNFTSEGAINSLNLGYLHSNIVQFTHPINKFLYVSYGGFPVYFIDENTSKVYFATDTEYIISNYKIQVSKYGVALLSEISPLVVGHYSIVAEIAKRAGEGNKSEISNYLSRINEMGVFAFFTHGKNAEEVVRFNQTNESIVKFFFQGFRYNFSSNTYEKIWAIHFKENYFFSAINETERDFEYYHFENFEDGFSVAVMGDKNFTKVLNAVPNVLGFIIKDVE